jgi:NhaP-type Na+/H+ or K+/H+ antiporter
MENAVVSTVTAVVAFGILAQIVANWIRVPSILILLLFGVALGPSALGWVQPRVFGDQFMTYVTLAVAIVLFEGGLSLSLANYRRISGPVQRMVFYGGPLTIIGGTVAARQIVGLSWSSSLLFGALIMVTGPTVIMPLLRKVRISKNPAELLRWEAVLNDPVGAIIAVVLLGAMTGAGEGGTVFALRELVIRLSVGVAVGGIGGFLVARLLRSRPPGTDEEIELAGLVVLASAVAFYGISEQVAHESGIMAATVGGLFVGAGGLPYLDEIKRFKGQLTTFIVSVLFILLAAQVPLFGLWLLFKPGLYLLLVVAFVIRPIVAFIVTVGSDFNWREKLFVGLVAPRGIIAASVAGYFGLVLLREKNLEGLALEALVFIIIAGTVTWAGLFARPLAWALRIGRSNPPGILMVSAGTFARELARLLIPENIPVKLVDRSFEHVHRARALGLEAHAGNALNADFLEGLGLEEIGRLWALTTNDEVNTLVSQVGRKLLGTGNVYQARGEAAGAVAEHFSETAGLPLFGEKFSVGAADSRLLGGGVRLVTVDKEKDLPLPDRFEPLLRIADGHAHPEGSEGWPAWGRFIGFLPAVEVMS